MATVGDMNGDGYTDFVVGASGFDGRAYVYFGGPGLDAEADLTLLGEVALDQFGFATSSAGDMNGDGYADVIVGAPGAADEQGRAYVYFGGPTPNADPDLVISGVLGSGPGNRCGHSVGTIGDTNKDGYDDVIVGVPGYTNNGFPGLVVIYFGSAEPDTMPDVFIQGTAMAVGSQVGRAGDVNGDGFEDVLVEGSETVYVFLGGPSLDGLPDLVLSGEAFGVDYDFGASLGTAGDVNGDGFGDFLVSAHQPGGHRAYLFLGGPVADGTPDVVINGQGPYDFRQVGAAGDVNADGYADWLLGAYGPLATGHVYVYYGSDRPTNGAPDTLDVAAPDLVLSGDWSSSLPSPAYDFVASPGDFDGDGFIDIVMGCVDVVGHVSVKGIYPYQVMAPNGGEQWVAGHRSVVRWRGSDPADLAVSYDGGSSWSTLAVGIGGLAENEYEITAPSTATEFAKVRLSYTGLPVKRATSDVSDGVFRIVQPSRTPASANRLHLTPTGATSNEFFGVAVSAAGDMNGDGYGDVIVGAYGYNDNQGRAMVYHGGPGADATADLTVTGEATSHEFGYSVGAAGDVNGDGYADVIVGAFGYAAGQGRAYVYYGGPSADAVADLTITGTEPQGNFATSVAGAGDVNGDGYADLIIGASAYNGAQGRAYVFHGGPGADTTPDLTLTGPAGATRFGSVVSTAGDFNGDGFSDVLVGAYDHQESSGRAYVYHGGTAMDPVADLTLNGEESYSYFGGAVSSAGDVNGDGYGDVIVGAWGYGGAKGRAYVFYGARERGALPDLVLTGTDASHFGAAVGAAGDVNDDGYSDFIVGAFGKGTALVYYGGLAPDAIADHTLHGEALDQFGAAVATAGDVTGDGHSDVIVGALFHDAGVLGDAGRAYVFDFNRHFLTSPNGGESWNVGAAKSVTWLGAEKANLWLSTDAGNTYNLIASGLGGKESNSWSLRVPHTPGKFTMMKVTPSDPTLSGSDRSDSLFTIKTSVSLLALTAAPMPDRAGAAVLSWNTDPGPSDLAGYRLEKAASGESWRTLVALTRETTFTDEAAGVGGARYRLFAVNGFQEELMLGETALRPMAPLSAWPLPYRGGALNVSFATSGGLGGAPGLAEVSIYDVSGRLVRTIARDTYEAGYRTAVWDGRNADGQRVAAGVYFVRARSGGEETTLKLAVLR